MQLWVQSKTYLRIADMLEFVLVVLNATELADHFSQDIVLTGANALHVTGHKVMYGENIGHFYIQCGFGPCVQIIEFIDVELSFGRRNINYCRPCQ